MRRHPQSHRRYLPSRLAALMLAPALMLAGHGPAWALSTDREQPVEIEADFAEFDDVAGTAVYKGDVVATQGSIRVTGDVMTVKFTAEREMKEILVDGRPATFRQRPEGQDEDVEGEGLRVEYFPRESLVYVKRNATLREGGKLLSGDEIVYDTTRSVVTARKAPAGESEASAEDATKPRQRVRVILPPNRPPAPAATAPAEEAKKTP